jgi:uncharacterized membrane protein required for colicin V production
MIDDNDPIKNRMSLPEAMSAGHNAFLSSWWVLFMFVVPLAFIFYPQILDHVRPYIDSIEDKNSRGNAQMLAFFIYTSVCIGVPFLIFYKLGKFLEKKKISKKEDAA